LVVPTSLQRTPADRAPQAKVGTPGASECGSVRAAARDNSG